MPKLAPRLVHLDSEVKPARPWMENILLLPRQIATTAPSASSISAVVTATSATLTTSATISSASLTSASTSTSASSTSSNSSTGSGSSTSSNASLTSSTSSCTSSQTSSTASEKAETKQGALIFGIVLGVFGLITVAVFGGWAILGWKSHRRRKRYLESQNLELNNSPPPSGKEHPYEELDGLTPIKKQKSRKNSKKSKGFGQQIKEDDDDLDSRGLLDSNQVRNSVHQDSRPISYDPYIQAAMNSPQLGAYRRTDDQLVDDEGEDVESIMRRTESEHQRDLEKYENVLEIVKGIATPEGGNSPGPSSPFMSPSNTSIDNELSGEDLDKSDLKSGQRLVGARPLLG